MSNDKHKSEKFVEWKRKVLFLVDEKIRRLKRSVKRHKTNPVLKREEVISYLEKSQEKYVLVPIDKAANNFAIICKRFYVSVILKEIGILGSGNKTYEKSGNDLREIILLNLEHNKRLNLESGIHDEKLPIMY